MRTAIPPALLRNDPVPLDEKMVWDVRDAARATGLSARTLQQAIAAGALPSIKVGRRRLLDPSDVRAWLNSQRVSK